MKHNWQYKKLGEICDKGSTNLMQKNLELVEEGFEVFGASGSLGRIGFYQQEHPYVGIVKDGSGVGRCNIYPAKSSLLGTMQYILAKDCVSNAFLCYLLKSLDLSKYVNGAAIPHIYFRDYKKEIVPLPPLEEQQRIVAELDRINGVMEDCRQLLRTLDTLAQSLFYDFFGDPISNPKAWPTQPLKEVAPASSSKAEPEESNGKFWLLNLDQIESNTGRIIEKQFFSIEEIGASTVLFDENNVLYSKLRPYLNKVVIPNGRGYCTSELIPLKPTKLLKEYLAYSLRLPEFVQYISGKTGGAKMPRVKMNFFWDFQLPLPPLEMQQQFARRIEAIEAQKKAVEKTIATLQTLLDSRMDYWFN